MYSESLLIVYLNLMNMIIGTTHCSYGVSCIAIRELVLLQRLHYFSRNMGRNRGTTESGKDKSGFRYHPSFIAPIALTSVPSSKFYSTTTLHEHSYPSLGLYLVLSPLQLHLPLKAFVRLATPSGYDDDIPSEMTLKSLPDAALDQVYSFYYL